MGDTLVLDTAHVGVTAELLDRLAARALELSSTIERALFSAELPRTSAAIVVELGDELAALSRYLTATIERATIADRLGSSVDGEDWFAAMRADWADAERTLWNGLNDDVGAAALDAGEFSLADSLVAIDRPTWMRTAIPPGCRSFGPDAYYTGGGAVRGPDGRLYPIVVPHVQRGEEHYTIDADIADGTPTAASLDGQDPGWVVVSYRTGVEQIHAEISGTWQALMAAAFATGLRSPGYVDDDHLVASAIREFLYITLYEVLLDAVAAEHGMRLMAAESAMEWLENTSSTTARRLAGVRSEASTQELLDIVAGGRRIDEDP